MIALIGIAGLMAAGGTASGDHEAVGAPTTRPSVSARVLGEPEPTLEEAAEKPAWGIGKLVPELAASADLAFLSKYVWRGQLLTDGPVFEPAFTIGYKGLSVNLWGNLDLDDVNGNEGQFNEVDYTLDYTFVVPEWDALSLSGGAVVYDFPNTAFETTTELYAGAELDVPLQPSIKAYLDVDEAEGFYVTAGLSHGIELPKLAEGIETSLDLSLAVGWASPSWNGFYFGAERAGFTDLYAGASLPVNLLDGRVTVAPTVAYTGLLDGGIRDEAGEPDNVVWGVVISVRF